jgi:hypothetical protein
MSTYDRVVASQSYTGLPEYIVEEVTHMTVYETITVILSGVGLLISLGMLIVALLSYLHDKKQK